jgi:hypothetical protein
MQITGKFQSTDNPDLPCRRAGFACQREKRKIALAVISARQP